MKTPIFPIDIEKVGSVDKALPTTVYQESQAIERNDGCCFGGPATTFGG